MELLAPAGNMESFIAALEAGADAIYLAGKTFGARGYAQNFTNEQLEEVIKLGKIYGVKVYITMNTLVKNSEVSSFLEQVEFLYHHGVDAIIMQDFGMMSLCRKKYPNLEIHASTQFNSANIETIKLLHEMGIKRVVLPREMSFEEIKKLSSIPIEKEVFVHGALCVSYSGCCLFSQRLGGRSGNRGVCAGSCRLPYQLYLNGEKIKEGYLLSTKELKVGSDINKLEGYVHSLKIEGRMKSPSYVSFITSYYQDILHGKAISLDREEDLQSLFYREFTKGHLFGAKHIINSKSPNHIGLPIGKVIQVSKDKIKILLSKSLHQGDGVRFIHSKKGMIVNFIYDEKDRLIRSAEAGDIVFLDNKIGIDDTDIVHKTTNALLEVDTVTITRKVSIQIKVIAKKGKPFLVTFMDDNNHEVCYVGDIVEKSKSMPITENKIKEQISKLGNSPFIQNSIDIICDEDIFIRIGEINIARRTLTERLIGKRVNDYKDPIICDVCFDRIQDSDSIDICQYEMVPRNTFCLNPYLKEKNIVSEIFKVDTLDCIGSCYLNVYNSYTAYYLYQLGYKAVTLSVELTEEEILEFIHFTRKKFGFIPLIVLSSGDLEVMIIKDNVLELDLNLKYTLIDKLGHSFVTYYDGRLTHVLSHEKLSLDRNIFPKDVIYL